MYLTTMDDFQIRNVSKPPNGIQRISLESVSNTRKSIKLVVEFDNDIDTDLLIDNSDVVQLATQLALKIKELGRK